MTYRPDIDGLRAIAVVAVILNHAMPGVLPGGFLGVDVFFLISGYLIATIMFRDMDAGTFSPGRFYARRVKRLAPALMICVAGTLVIGHALLLPDDLLRAAKTAFFALTSLSNIYLAGQAGYFDPDLATNPLMHTWSLAVEEQFYLLFPVVVLFARDRTRKLLPAILGLGLVVSLALGQYLVLQAPAWGYFILPGRGWEILLGVLLAHAQHTGSIPALPSRARDPLALACLATLGLSLVWFGPATLHPGLPTLAPMLATTGLLLLGSTQGQRSVVSRLLSCKPLCHLGVISYSLYLWHQPILAYRHEWTGMTPSALEACVLLLAIYAAGYASWRFIEMPFRHAAIEPSRTLRLFGVASAALCLLAFVTISQKGFPGRVPQRIHDIVTNATPEKRRSRECHLGQYREFDPADICNHNITDGALPRVAVWGDSHAASLSSGLISATDLGFEQMSVSGCKPLIDITWRRDHSYCAQPQRDMLQHLLSQAHIDTVIIHARWSDRTGYEQVAEGLEPAIRALRAEDKQVLLVDPVPEYPWSVPKRAAVNEWRRGSGRPSLSIPSDEYNRRHAAVLSVLDELSRLDGVRRVEVADLYCNLPGHEGKCLAESDAGPLYFDDDHLNTIGAARLANRLADLLRIQPAVSRKDDDPPIPPAE